MIAGVGRLHGSGLCPGKGRADREAGLATSAASVLALAHGAPLRFTMHHPPVATGDPKVIRRRAVTPPRTVEAIRCIHEHAYDHLPLTGRRCAFQSS